MGCISAVEHVPMDALFNHLQNGDEPNFGTMNDAQIYMGTVMRLWNKLAEHQEPHNPFCFSFYKIGSSRGALKNYLKLAIEEDKGQEKNHELINQAFKPII